jgi:hypothetical protein
MSVSIKSPTSTTGSIQLNASDAITIDSSSNITVPNNLTVTGTVTQTGGATFNGGISGNVNFDSGTLYVDATNNRVGIGTTTPSSSLHLYGSSSALRVERTGSDSAALITKTTLGHYGAGTGIGTATNCFNVYDYNASAERMRIDSSGRVTMPYQPMAMINSNVTYNLPGSTTEVVWTNVSVNTGSHYSTSTGRFTAPVAGKYLVTASFHGPATSGSRGYIARNGTQIKGWAGSVDADWGNFGTQVIADLSSGDYISVYIWGGNYVHGDPAWGGWSIQLIG